MSNEPKNPHTGSSFEEFMAKDMDPMPGGFNISDVQIAKLTLAPGEVLTVRIYSDTIGGDDLAMLKRQLTSVFPSNRIMLFSMPKGDRLDLEVIAPAVQEQNSCAEPASYCNDCRCGKKERIESQRED